MRICVLLNRKSGALRGGRASALARAIDASFAEHGRQAEVMLLAPYELPLRLEALRDAASPPDAVIVGGGDGSVSTAARLLVGTDIALGVLPLGTFNLFARAIDMPLDPRAAVDALVTAEPARVDTMQINGRTVLQHASIGLQPQMILLRERLAYHSRADKLLKSVIAWIKVLRRPPVLVLRTWSDAGESVRRTPGLLISNNPVRSGLGEAPVSRSLDQNRIAIYLCTSRRRADLVKVSLAAPLGLWRETGVIEEILAREAEFSGRSRRLLLSVDGELAWFDTPLRCRSVPSSLRVLKPVVDT